uniref:Fork-head domain-containing protein n=1 Tax=Salvator merianae TaxID=96440 RepID=A0A8D0E9K2_SALMN
MELRLQKPAFWASLHLRSGLFDWDLSRELLLGSTCDQVCQGEKKKWKRSGLKPPPPVSGHHDWQPNLWMWVNPNLVCPIPGHASAAAPLPGSLPGSGPGLQAAPAPQEDSALPQKARATHVPWKAKALRSRSRRLKRTQGGWPRPPLNYCILISLALSSSVDSSLTVQEIYQFTRQHFPFFRTAPEGWKNTVRHNLCFSNSFEKTTDFVCLEGNRKSRLWKLTTEGRRKFQAETCWVQLSKQVEQSALTILFRFSLFPELMRSLFGL